MKKTPSADNVMLVANFTHTQDEPLLKFSNS